MSFDRADKFNFVLRQTIADRFFAADFRRHARRHGLAVAGNHRDAAHAVFLQFRQRFLRFGAGFVLHADPADAFAVAGDKNQTPAFGLVQVDRFFETRHQRRCPSAIARGRPKQFAPLTCALMPRPAVSAKSFGSASGTPASSANCASALAVG